jgi:mRNA interferase MazF
MAAYLPSQGDFVVLNFDPQAGHEQRGRRPALVVSKNLFNKATGMAICCPVTNTDRGIPFHVAITGRTRLTGFVMCEQVKSLDFRARGLKKIGTAPKAVLEEVLSILDASLY